MTSPEIRPRRSLIFVPGLKPELLPKALNTGADMVCVDLEDAIAPADKDEARGRTLELFAEAAPEDGVERLIRINGLATPEGLRDVDAVLQAEAPPQGLMLPKVKSADEVRLLDELFSGAGMDVRFHVIIETNAGLRACHDIAEACGRVASLLFGGVDMAAELRVENTWEAMVYTRSRIVHAAAGAGIDAIDVPYLDFKDSDGLQAQCAAAAGLGFTGKAAIHPSQIPVINACFTPSPEGLEQAKRIIAAFEAGDGGLVVVDGSLIEKPVLRSMYRILAVAERAGG